jgi:hypothetical protein
LWRVSVKTKKSNLYGGTYIFFVLGCLVTGVVQVAVIQYSIKAAGAFDRLFVNGFQPAVLLRLHFLLRITRSDLLVACCASPKKIIGLPAPRYLVRRVHAHRLQYLPVTTMIRSSANPSVDMYNVDNPNSLVGYLSREQYGDFPLLYGQKFTSQPAALQETSMRYQKSKDKYIELGKDRKYVYNSEDKMVFPRVWDASNDQSHADYYAYYLGINRTRDGQYDRTPTQGDNVKFFMGYQTYWMYIRYFMWNFAGKQNDNQGLFAGNVRDGNWISGLPTDNLMYGDQSAMPDSLKNNKAHNRLFALPLILGIIGLIYQFRRKKDDGVVNLLLFFFTGFAIVLYLNQAGYQPRERDYAYVGSFYAFAVWIGLGVLKVRDWFSKRIGSNKRRSIGNRCLSARSTGIDGAAGMG